MSLRAEAEAEFARRILPLARRWRAEADRAVADLGLSDATGWLLIHVGRLGDGARQIDLAAALDIQGASLVRLVDQVETAGLVERRTDPQDRRANRIFLTEAGRVMAGQIETSLRAIRQHLFEGVDDRDLDTANRVLASLDQRMLAQREKAR
jgi:MarR family transcriptional regulator for hemolysin